MVLPGTAPGSHPVYRVGRLARGRFAKFATAWASDRGSRCASAPPSS